MAARVRTFWVLGALVVFAGAYGLWVFARSPFFSARSIQVQASRHVTRADILARAAIPAGANVWMLNVREVERKIEKLPYVLKASVKRSPPASLTIAVIERTPDGCVRGSAGDVVVDAADRVLTTECSPELVVYLRDVADPSPGRFLNDPTLKRLQHDAHALAAAGERLTNFREDGYGQLEASLADGIRIEFGDDRDLDRKSRLIGPVLATQAGRIESVAAIDLRSPAAPVVIHKH